MRVRSPFYRRRIEQLIACYQLPALFPMYHARGYLYWLFWIGVIQLANWTQFRGWKSRSGFLCRSREKARQNSHFICSLVNRVKRKGQVGARWILSVDLETLLSELLLKWTALYFFMRYLTLILLSPGGKCRVETTICCESVLAFTTSSNVLWQFHDDMHPLTTVNFIVLNILL